MRRCARLPKDAVVVKRGDKGIGFYVVLDGAVQVRKGSTVLAKLGPGDFFGELALFDNKVRSADVVALEPTTVVTLSRWEFWGFASEHPEYPPNDPFGDGAAGCRKRNGYPIDPIGTRPRNARLSVFATSSRSRGAESHDVAPNGDVGRSPGSRSRTLPAPPSEQK